MDSKRHYIHGTISTNARHKRVLGNRSRIVELDLHAAPRNPELGDGAVETDPAKLTHSGPALGFWLKVDLNARAPSGG